MKRSGFTMIELVFVIVILGILASVAIPKLAATRDDAKISADVASLKQVISNLGGEYTASATVPVASVTEANAALDCFVITQNGAITDGNFTIAAIANATPACSQQVLPNATIEATNTNLLEANGAAKTIVFGGSLIVR